ncbi:hypothetical protein ACS0TY_001951 [Phlomoides rotata]
MPIPFRLYTLLTEFSVFGFHKEFLLSIFIGFILIDFFTCLKHLIQDHDLRYGFHVFKISKEVSDIPCLFLLFALGFKALYSPSFRVLVQFLCDFRRNSGKFKNQFCSENGNCVRLKDLVEESRENSNNSPGSDRKISRELNKGVEEYTEEDDECYRADEDESKREEDDETDVSRLRKLVKIERSRANAAVAEVVKERAASATAAEEAMAMIMRLQNEKSSIEMESSQYRRLAEEKQIHDHQVIESLQWLVWRNETEMKLLQEELNRLLKSDEESDFRLEEDLSENVVKDVFCSSLDFNLSLH